MNVPNMLFGTFISRWITHNIKKKMALRDGWHHTPFVSSLWTG